MPFDQSFVDFAISQWLHLSHCLYAGPTLDINVDDLQTICYTNLELF